MSIHVVEELKSLHEHLLRAAVMPGLEPCEVDRLAAMVGEVQIMQMECTRRVEFADSVERVFAPLVVENGRWDQTESEYSAYQHSRESACFVPQESPL